MSIRIPREGFFIDALVSHDGHWIKPTGALNVWNQLGGFWRLVCFFTMVPLGLRDRIYGVIAHHR